MIDLDLEAMLDRLALKLLLADHSWRARECQPTFGPSHRCEITIQTEA